MENDRKLSFHKLNTLFIQGLFFYFLMALGVVFIFFILTFNRTFHMIESIKSDYDNQIFQSVSEKLETQIKNIEQLTSIPYLGENQIILQDIESSEESSYSTIEFYHVKSQFFHNFEDWLYFLNSQNLIHRFFLVNSNGVSIERGVDSFAPGYNFKSDELYQRALRSGGRPAYQIGYEEYIDSDKVSKEEIYLKIARKINITSDRFLVIYIIAKFDPVEDLLQSIMHRGYTNFIILNENDQPVYYTQPEYVELVKQNKDTITRKIIKNSGNKQVVALSGYYFTYTGWKFFAISSEDTTTRISQIFFSNMQLMIIIIIIVAFLFAFLFSKSITEPISKLVKYTQYIREGKFDQSVKVKGPHEIIILSDAMNSMSNKLSKIINQNYILSLREKEARLNALQSQINPHFLYNTLNTIGMLAEIANIPTIAKAAQALSDMFRYNIKSTSKLVSIREELEHVDNYLCIQNIRYDNAIQYQFNIPEEILGYKTIKFVLQPIVENAIYHGLELKKGEKKITITAQRKEDLIILWVEDNGLGIPHHKLESLQKNLDSFEYIEKYSVGSLNVKSEIGLINVHQRIRIYYGEPCGLQIQSEQNIGTTVQICLKLCT